MLLRSSSQGVKGDKETVEWMMDKGVGFEQRAICAQKETTTPKDESREGFGLLCLLNYLFLNGRCKQHQKQETRITKNNNNKKKRRGHE